MYSSSSHKIIKQFTKATNPRTLPYENCKTKHIIFALKHLKAVRFSLETRERSHIAWVRISTGKTFISVHLSVGLYGMKSCL